MRRWLCILLLACVSVVCTAQVVDRRPLDFANATEEARFHGLTNELRCVMCQNQSLADSDAQIAIDLRRQILELMREGRSDREIRDFMVDRYGEFVLYRPQVSPATWLLWFGPLLLLSAGGFVLWRVVRRGGQPTATSDAGRDGDW
jgi:cytochrome c-type biogenesis protein CcmH